jgi:tetratricopeptide (TPR) repeat protein
VLVAGALIVAAGAIAYSNSFGGPFIYDGKQSILDNHYIRRLWPITEAMKAPPQATTSGRPIVCLSLAVNYAISNLDVWSYHAFNLTVHLIAGLLLFGIVRRTLVSERLKERFGGASTVLASACALLWVLHPLNTQAVTYVIQRAESMMGMFYLLTLYCAVRGFASKRAGGWYVASVVACALGMGTKEVMVTAPLIVLLYDRIFVSRSFKELFRRHVGLYVGLVAGWLVLGAIHRSAPRSQSAGFGLKMLGPLEYAQTQCKVILRYIALAFYPDPLVLNYTRKAVRTFVECIPQGLLILAMLAGTGLALRYRPGLGFLGAWFFLILGPTSSFVPIADLIFEHRMYLSLAGVVALVVLGGYWGMQRVFGSSKPVKVVGLAIVLAVAGAMAATTHRRNNDYRDALTIWKDTVTKQPDNFSAWATLGGNYANRAMYSEAIDACRRAIELYPDISYAYNARAVAHGKTGQYEQAIADFTKAVEIEPTHSRAYSNRAAIYKVLGQYDLAIADCNESIRLNPRYAPTFDIRAGCYRDRGDLEKALADYTEAIRIDPRLLRAYVTRAMVWDSKGEWDRALADYTGAIEVNPRDPRLHNARGFARMNRGEVAEAIRDFDRAVELAPTLSVAWCNRGRAYLRMENYDRAIADFTKAIQCDPNFTIAYDNRGVAYAQKGDLDRALTDLDTAVRLDPSSITARNNRAAVLARKRAQ